MDDEVLDALAVEQRALASMIEPLERDALLTPSRCEGWTISHVLVHLAQTNEFAVASVSGRFSEAVDSGPDVETVSNVDEWAGAAVEDEYPDDPLEAADRWQASAGAQLEAFRSVDASERVPWVAGEMAARTLATTRLSETWIHSNDIATPLGITVEPTDRLRHIARLSHRTLPYAFMTAGKQLSGDVAFVLKAPDGSEWRFGTPEAATVIRGTAIELCEVAGQRAQAADTDLSGDGPDAADVLELVRTFA